VSFEDLAILVFQDDKTGRALPRMPLSCLIEDSLVSFIFAGGSSTNLQNFAVFFLSDQMIAFNFFLLILILKKIAV